MLGGWFRGAGASGLGGGVVDRSWRRRLLADIAAALGAQVCGLWALTGDTTSLVVHRGAAVEVFTDLDPSTSVRAALWASGDRDGTPLQRHDVIHADGAPVAEAEDVGWAGAGRETPVGGAGCSWRLAEAGVVSGEESGKRGVGLLQGADAAQSQFLIEAVLEGAPKALDPSFRLRGAGADPGDAELVEYPSDLGR